MPLKTLLYAIADGMEAGALEEYLIKYVRGRIRYHGGDYYEA